MKFVEAFNIKYPIICANMNQVSYSDLAIAVHNAGALSGISLHNHYQGTVLHVEEAKKELLKFKEKTGSTNTIVGIGIEDLKNQELIDFLEEEDFKTLELFHVPKDLPNRSEIFGIIKSLRSNRSFKIFIKSFKGIFEINYDYLIMKGPEGAGRSMHLDTTLDESFENFKSKRPNIPIIASGGISDSKDIAYYLNKGAAAVAIGTLFAASEESCISKETKIKMIESTSDDLKRFGKLNTQGIVFNHLEKDDINNTRSLKEGINGTARGSIFAGKSIDHVKEILPVKEIIARLTHDIN